MTHCFPELRKLLQDYPDSVNPYFTVFFFYIKNAFYDFREYQESRLPAFSRFRISTPISWFK